MHNECSSTAGVKAISESANQVALLVLFLFSIGPGRERMLLLFSCIRAVLKFQSI